jgi:thioredoxin 1
MALAITDAFEEVVWNQTNQLWWILEHGVVLVEWLNYWWVGYEYDGGKVVVGKVDVDANQEFAAK